MSNHKSGSMFGKLSNIFKAKKSLIEQMQEYMEFYFPASSKVTYNIIFDWGEYIITTEDKIDSEVHEDSKPYLGYITLRPMVTTQTPELITPFYIITPAGDVWENVAGSDIPRMSNRQEITEERTKHGVTKKTLTFQSVSEPVIDHFKEHPEKWTKYGKLDVVGGKTRLKLLER